MKTECRYDHRVKAHRCDCYCDICCDAYDRLCSLPPYRVREIEDEAIPIDA